MPRPEEINIHASCVAIGAKGVLLLGDSGAGKSDVALRLIDGGARLVADDRTILFAGRNALHARAPATIAGLLEIRGVGIVKMPARAQVTLALAVWLGREGVRLPEPQAYQALGLGLPQIALDGHFASTSARIRAALAAFSRARPRHRFPLP